MLLVLLMSSLATLFAGAVLAARQGHEDSTLVRNGGKVPQLAGPKVHAAVGHTIHEGPEYGNEETICWTAQR
jgi:hypothetical protein